MKQSETERIVQEIKVSILKAVEEIRKIPVEDRDLRVMYLVDLSMACAKVELTSDAAALAQEGSELALQFPADTYLRLDYLSLACAGLVVANRPDRVRDIANTLNEADRLILQVRMACWLSEKGYFDKALEFANDIPETELKSEGSARLNALDQICRWLSWRGRVDEALDVLERCIGPGQLPEKPRCLPFLYVELVKAGRFDDVLRISKTYDDLRTGRLEVAEGLAERGRLNEARDLADDALEDAIDQDWAVRRMVLILVKGGAFEEALEKAKQLLEIGSEVDYYEALRDISEALAKARKLDDALSLVQTIDEEQARLEALVRICQGLSESGEIETAIDVAGEIRDDHKRSEALYHASRALVKRGMLNVVINTALPRMDHYYRLETTGLIVRTYVEEERIEEATELVTSSYAEPDRILHLAEIYSAVKSRKISV